MSHCAKENFGRLDTVTVRWATAWLACGCFIAGIAGCGRSGPVVQYVEGIVTLDGEPLEGAVVTFRPTSGGLTAAGTTDGTGLYKLNALAARRGAGTMAGDYLVSILKWKESDGGPGPQPDPSDTAKFEAWQRENLKAASREPIYIAPKPYSDVKTSGLKVTVKKGRNSGDAFRFELTSDFKGL